MASGDLSNQVPILPGGFIKESLIGGMPGPLPDSQQRHWIPDERDAFISWLRGEFAAANAIIDALCHHLQVVGKPGEYDFVLTCIQQRRYNWTVVLHMQQYFSVAEVVLALQQVVWLKQALNSDPSGLPPLFGSLENGGGPPWKEGPIIYRDPRAEAPMPASLGLQQQHSVSEEHFVRRETLEVPRKSEEQGDRRRSGAGDTERPQPSVSCSADPVVSPARNQTEREEQATGTEAGTRSGVPLSEEELSSASTPVFSQGISEPKEEKESDKRSNGQGDWEGRSSIKSESSEGYSSESASIPEFHISSKEEEDQRRANVKVTKSYSCMEPIDGKLVNIVDGLELHERVLDVVESSRLALLIQDIRTAGRRGELGGSTFVGSKRGAKGKGRELLQFGHSHHHLLEDHKKRSFSKDDFVKPVPAFLEAIIDRLVRWQVVPASKRPDCCSICILEEGDYLPSHTDNLHLERPYCTLTLQSECTMVLGQSLTTGGAPGDFKGPLQISLSVGSVLVLQRHSSDIARHCIPASGSKRIIITLGKALSTRPSRGYTPSAGNSQPMPLPGSTSATSWGPSYNNTSNRQGNNNTLNQNNSGRTGSFSAPFKSHKYAPVSSGGVLPNPTSRPPAQIPSVNNSVPPLFSGSPGPPAGVAFPPPTMTIPSWGAPVPRPPPPNRPPTAGTGVFFPAGGSSSGPGRPASSMPGQRRSGNLSSAPPLLQKTNSAPASFASLEAAAIAAAASPSTPPGNSSKTSSFTGSVEKVVPPPIGVSPSVATQDASVASGKVSTKEPASDSLPEANGTKTRKEENTLRSSGRALKAVAGSSRTSVVSTGVTGDHQRQDSR